MDTETLLLGPFRNHGLTILVTALMFYSVQRAALVAGRLFIPSFKLLTKQEQADFAVRIVSVLHCIITFATIPGYFYPAWENSLLATSEAPLHHFFNSLGYLSPPTYPGNQIPIGVGLPVNLPEFPTPDEFQAVTYSYSPLSQFFFATTAGYFLWDIFISIGFGWGPFFIVHAFASFGVYYFSLFPFLHYFGRFFHGVFEISTIWLHLRELLALVKLEKSVFYHLFGNVFAVSFIIVRVVLGCYVSFLLWMNCLELIELGKAHSNHITMFLLGSDFVVMCLQLFWFFKILEQALGPFLNKTPDPKPLKIE